MNLSARNRWPTECQEDSRNLPCWEAHRAALDGWLGEGAPYDATDAAQAARAV